VRRWDSAAWGLAPPGWIAKLYHDVKSLSNLCYDWSSPFFQMLRFLSIRRLAVIDAVEVEFDAGLNVLTGETGAGKSILVEAVGLLLGGRASADLVRTGEDTATIEAIFDSGGAGVGEPVGELIVRREITAQGRSRAFINGELVTAGALKDLSSRLVELHGQHEHQTLLDPTSHLSLLDEFGAHDELRVSTATAYDTLRASAEALAHLRRAAADRGARQELAAFQLAELDRASLPAAHGTGEPGEDEALAATRQVLANAERVERLCTESYASLYENDDAVLGALGAVWRRVTELAELDPRFQPYLDARDGIKSQLEDLAMFLRRYADGIEASPARLQQIEERLALLERLKRKYGPTLAEVIAKRAELRSEVDDLEHSDERLVELERDRAAARGAFLRSAGALGKARRAAAADFARKLEALLAELAMERTKFEVRFSPDPLAESAWSAQGIDQGEFFVSPNAGEDLRPLARIVSGGELSRVMLALKTLTAQAKGDGAPGLIFDEVDAGIGGRVADVVGQKLRGLGATFQVLCITHLPQIAAAADTHFQIEKRVAGGRTRTSVVRLDDNGRVEELSRMLGGAGVTDTVRESAREMLKRHRAKPKGESERAKAKGREWRRNT
jgi:DNA repair protein RecN (Recombination protein N)